MATLAWNPTDGGTYEEAIAKLTVDANGVRGDEAGFDKSNVEIYGLGPAGSGRRPARPSGAPSPTATAGAHRREPVGHRVQLRRPEVPGRHHLVAGLIDKGYMPPAGEDRRREHATTTSAPGSTADHRNGSWMTGSLHRPSTASTLGIAPTPVGPIGQARQHVQRARRLDLRRHRQQGGGLEVGRVPRLGRSARTSSATPAVVFPAIPSAVERPSAGLRGQERRRDAVHRAGRGRARRSSSRSPTTRPTSTRSCSPRWMP